MPHRFVFLAGVLVALSAVVAPGNTNDTASQDEQVRRALARGAQLIDRSVSTQSLDHVKQQWIRNALERSEHIQGLKAALDAADPGSTVPARLRAEMLLFSAYSGFLNSELRNVLMREDEKGLACHLWFNTKHGPVDIVYAYDKAGTLQAFRIDRLPKGVSAYMSSEQSSRDYIVLWFQDADVSIVLNRTDPFAAFVLAD